MNVGAIHLRLRIKSFCPRLFYVLKGQPVPIEYQMEEEIYTLTYVIRSWWLVSDILQRCEFVRRFILELVLQKNQYM